MKLPKLTLVTGGAASGKSAFAEGLVLGAEGRPVYLATAQVWDDEMSKKVAEHIARRADTWRTQEVPVDVPEALNDCTEQDCVLLDCATLWLTNLVMAEADLDVCIGTLLNALAQTKARVVVVTNELGQGVVPENALARRFRNHHGRMNQKLAAQADWVFGVMAGLPFSLKGPDPRSLS